jgi:hypothetical protein
MTSSRVPFLRPLCSLALVGLALVTACDDGGGGRGGAGSGAVTKGDDLEETASGGPVDTAGDETGHHASLLECEEIAAHVREHLGATRYASFVDLERDRNDCLVTVNDRAMPDLEAILEAAADPYAGQAVAGAKRHRSEALEVCGALAEAHVDAESGSLAAISFQCVADMERQMGLLLDAHADFGVAPFSIPGDRDRFGACYTAFDEAVASGSGTDPIADEAMANDVLSSCLLDVQEAALADVAARVAENFSGRDPATIEADVSLLLGELAEARQRICEVATHAGPGRAEGGFVASVARCMVDSALLTTEAFDLVAPGAIADDGGPDDGSTTNDGSTTDDGGTTDEGGTTDDGGTTG